MENFKSFYIFVLVISVLRKSISSSSLEDVSLTKEGDVVLGVLFPLYRQDSRGDCTVLNKDALLWIKALNFALDELKSCKNPWIRNVTFGLYLRDTCSRPALEHSLDLLHLNKQTGSLKKISSKVVAVLTNSNDVDSSTLLSLFRVPQILFSEHLPVHENENPGTFLSHQPYYFESIKTSYYRAKSLVGLIKYFQWKSVSVVVNKPYSKEYLMFKHFAEMENICLAAVLDSSKLDTQDASADNLLYRLGHGLGVRVVILFTGEKDTLKVIQGVGARNPSHYIWIDAMGTTESITQDLSRTTESVLTLAPDYLFLEELKNHIVRPDCKEEVSEQSSKDVPEMLLDSCDMEVSSRRILDDTLKAFAAKQSRDTRTRVAHRRAIEIQGIVNSVFEVGHAVSRHLETKCWDKTKEECFETFSSHHLAEELQILIQKFFQGDNSQEKYFLKENLFSLISFHGNSSGPPSRVVGTWDNKSWFINRVGITWPGKSPETPDSTCGPKCPLGHIQVTEKGRQCCWSCQPCNYNQYITNTSTCADCVRGYWPSKDFRSCEFKLQLTVLSCTIAISSVAAVLYSLVL